MNARFMASLILATLMTIVSAARASDDLTLDDVRDWNFYNDTGWLYLNRGDYINAELRFLAAIKVVRSERADDPRLLARSYHDLALVLYHQRRYAEAEPMARWSLTEREKNKRDWSGSVFQSVYTLALIHHAQRHYAEAERLFKRALAIQEANLGTDHAAEAHTCDKLASVYCDRNKYREAETLYLRAIELLEKNALDDILELAEALENYAALLRRTAREEKAVPLESRASSIRKKVSKAEAERAKEGAEPLPPIPLQPPPRY